MDSWIDSKYSICYIVIVHGNHQKPMSKKATLKEVALAASVSAQTVSRVVNKHPDVAEHTRLRIQNIIDEMGYQPNTIARSLITRQSYTLGVVTTGFELYGPSTVLVGLQQEADQLGYSLSLILTTELQKENFGQILNKFDGRQVDGIIWAVPPVNDNREIYLAPILSKTPPVIFLNQPQPGLSVVAIDNYHGAVLATQHLISKIYHNIGIITGPAAWWEASERYRGWIETITKEGLPFSSSQVIEGDWTASSGEKAFYKLVKQNPDLDAVFVSNDQMAVGALKAAHSLGINIPEKMGVIGFDDTSESEFTIPSLSTIRQPLHELGAAAVREVVQIIRARRENFEKYEPKTITLQPGLVIRESTRRSETAN